MVDGRGSLPIPMKGRLLRVALLLVGSGMTALIYQVAWMRELRLVFGFSTAASAAVLAIFMGGLGFGGWLLGQMDIAGGIFAAGIAKGRTATVAVDAMTFRNPVSVGDVMCIYTDLIRIGNTSVTVHVEAWVIRRNQSDRLIVTDGNFTYVALDDERRPRPIKGQDYVVR